jgi:hypothetical protein
MNFVAPPAGFVENFGISQFALPEIQTLDGNSEQLG